MNMKEITKQAEAKIDVITKTWNEAIEAAAKKVEERSMLGLQYELGEEVRRLKK